MAHQLKPIEPKSQRWEPSTNPAGITVPGLDTTAPVNDQIEQIEQLITIKLQGIDKNFSKIQQIMANRILPSVKRYAVGTEPVREAAKFWTTFFEQSAQIRVPTYEDYSAQEEGESHVAADITAEHSVAQPSMEHTPTRSTFNLDGTSSEVSFMPADAAVSSTPATVRHRSQSADESYAIKGDPTPSWTASLESPLVRLDREIQSLHENEDFLATPAAPLFHEEDSQDITQRQIDVPPEISQPSSSSKGKGKGREPPQPLLHNVLRRNADVSTARNHTIVSPLKVKPKTPNLKRMNPYLPPDTNPSDWKGVVDLADPTISSPVKPFSSTAKRRYEPSASKRPKTPTMEDLDDSFDEGLGMSPPITMDWARLPKAKTPKLGKTPKKAAAEKVIQDLLAFEKRGALSAAERHILSGAASESSMSSAPTPPSLARYSRHPYPASEVSSSTIADASLQSMMRRVGLEGFDASHGAYSSNRDYPLASSAASTAYKSTASSSSTRQQPSASSIGDFQTPDIHQFGHDFRHLQDEELTPHGTGDADSDSDSMEYDDGDNTANPSAPFLFASHNPSYEGEDSFGSDHSSDSFQGDEPTEGMPVHHFGQAMSEHDDDGFDDDDSFDNQIYDQSGPEEETLFGVPPAQRLQAARQSQGNIRMLGQELLEDTIGIGEQLARTGRVDETPTPYGRP